MISYNACARVCSETGLSFGNFRVPVIVQSQWGEGRPPGAVVVFVRVDTPQTARSACICRKGDSECWYCRTGHKSKTAK